MVRAALEDVHRGKQKTLGGAAVSLLLSTVSRNCVTSYLLSGTLQERRPTPPGRSPQDCDGHARHLDLRGKMSSMYDVFDFDVVLKSSCISHLIRLSHETTHFNI